MQDKKVRKSDRDNDGQTKKEEENVEGGVNPGRLGWDGEEGGNAGPWVTVS